MHYHDLDTSLRCGIETSQHLAFHFRSTQPFPDSQRPRILLIGVTFLCAALLQRFDSTEKYLMLKHKVSHLLPEVFEEHIVKVYAKDSAKVRLLLFITAA